jgi:hypothetical protein
MTSVGMNFTLEQLGDLSQHTHFSGDTLLPIGDAKSSNRGTKDDRQVKVPHNFQRVIDSFNELRKLNKTGIRLS